MIFFQITTNLTPILVIFQFAHAVATYFSYVKLFLLYLKKKRKENVRETKFLLAPCWVQNEHFFLQTDFQAVEINRRIGIDKKEKCQRV